MDDRDLPLLERAIEQIWDKAHEFGLDPLPTHFEIVPATVLYEFGAYLLPGRFSHWTHGKAYYQMKTHYDYGLSKIYELVINADPAYAFLLDTNSLLHNKFVVAHVLGHADFFHHNVHFVSSNRQMVETAAQTAARFRQYAFAEGDRTVEQFLDATLAIADHVDSWPRKAHPSDSKPGRQRRAANLPWDDLFPAGAGSPDRETPRRRGHVPPEPEIDLLRFLLDYAPELEDWQRDILASVREDSLYFLPQLKTKVMNEGWPSVPLRTTQAQPSLRGDRPAPGTHSKKKQSAAGQINRK